MKNKIHADLSVKDGLIMSTNFEKRHYVKLYVLLYIVIFLLPFLVGLNFGGKTGAYPDMGECVFGIETTYYFNALSDGKASCLLIFEGLWGLQWTLFILATLLFYPLYKLRTQLWQGKRLGAPFEWVLMTLSYWLMLMFFSDVDYPNFYERIETLKAVLEIFWIFLIWQIIVTISFYVYRFLRHMRGRFKR